MHTPPLRLGARLRPTASVASLLAVGALLSACGGGSGEVVTATADGFQVESGLAQKGPLTMGSSVSINELNPATMVPLGTSYNFEIGDDDGSFKTANTVFKQRLLETTATGYYLDELTGQVSTDTVTLRGMSDLSVDRAINVNLLTDLSNARIRALVTRPSGPMLFSAARAQAQREVLEAFQIRNIAELLAGGTQPASFGELDLSKSRNADQMLTALSAVVTQIGVTGSGISRFINQFETDLADDGQINNSPRFAVPLASQLTAAYKAVDFEQVASHLNTFYGTTVYTAQTLSRWVDSSGSEDRVIDLYKSTALNVSAGTESRSAVYVAGSDDAGQCLSATAGKLYQNGRLVTTATVMAAKGEQFTLGLSGTLSQGEVVGYLQRNAPTNGTCPAKVPTTSTVRLAKHTLSIAGAVLPKVIVDLYEHPTPQDQVNATVYALRGNGTVWFWNTATRGVPTELFKDTSITGFLPHSGQKIRVQLKSGVTGHFQPYFNTRTGKMAAAVTKETAKQSCSTGSPENSSVTLRQDGSVWVKGGNANGQLGDGSTFEVAKEKSIGTQYLSLVCLGRFAGTTAAPAILALKKDGTLMAWGGNASGVLGDGSTSDILAPKVIGTAFSSVLSNSTSTVALKEDGSLWSWGSNSTTADAADLATGILGNSTNSAALSPVKIGSGFRAIALLGGDRVAAVRSSGELLVWGKNAAPLIGSSGNLYSPMPIDTRFVSLQGDEPTASGAANVAFGFQQDGSAWGWSPNTAGQLGLGTTAPSVATPQRIGGDFRKLFGQGDHVFGIKTDGTLWAWGSNTWGQFGDGTTSDSLTPRQIVLP